MTIYLAALRNGHRNHLTQNKFMKILAIETSCDETAVSVVECGSDLKRPRFDILSNAVSSQIKIHAPFGGVVPTLAKREHQTNLIPTLKKALKESNLLISKQIPIRQPADKFQILKSVLEREPDLFSRTVKYVLPMKPPKIGAIAVTAGPGLEPALWVGVNFARALSFLWKKPLIEVNHVEGHILANWLKPVRENPKSENRNPKIIFPALCLIVSGGHTQLVLMRDFGKYKIIGETRDDAAGEAFDKAAKMLGLGFPGGPAIARQAERWKSEIRNPSAKGGFASGGKFQTNLKSQIPNSKQVDNLEIKLPRPMIDSNDYDFSFSGLKTAVLYLVKDLRSKGYSLKKIAPAICAEFQQAAIDVLVSKTIRAAKQFKVKSVLLGGGVSANRELRGQLEKAVKEKLFGVYYHQPALEFTGDNAAMIAAAAWLHLKDKKDWRKLKARANWKIQ